MSEHLSKTAVTSAVAVLLVAWLIVLWPLPRGLFKESDTFWLIEVGSNILHHLFLPGFDGGVDPYSFAAVKSPWIIYQWLSEVLMSLASYFGLIGVSILGAVTLGLLLCVLIFQRMLRLGVNAFIALVVIAIALHSTFPDIATSRPQLFSFVFLFLLQMIAEDVWAGDTKSPSLKSVLIRTFVIGMLWANFHVSFPLGFAILILYLCAAFMRVVSYKDTDKGRLKIFALMTGVYFGATLINPYGIRLWFFLQTLNSDYITQEMQPLDWSKRLAVHRRLFSLDAVDSFFVEKRPASKNCISGDAIRLGLSARAINNLLLLVHRSSGWRSVHRNVAQRNSNAMDFAYK